jgi:hypothetical protein
MDASSGWTITRLGWKGQASTQAQQPVHLFLSTCHTAPLSGIGCQGTLWTGIHTSRGLTLPALENAKVMWKLFKWILDYLDAGQGQVLTTFMNQGASQHTAQAALAFV